MLLSGKRIVAIGGGTGLLTVLAAVAGETEHLSVIVTMAEDGGSTGILREEFGILPTADIRRALVALSASDRALLAQLMGYRFEGGSGLAGHAFGNLLLTALQKITGDVERAIGEAQRLLGARGTVIPVTLDSAQLAAELEDGTQIRGKSNVDLPTHDPTIPIRRVWLDPTAKINPRAAATIREANAIVIGPGDPFTNVIPNLLVSGMREALTASRAATMYLVNILTKSGETTGFAASDFVRVVESYAGTGTIRYAIVNTARPAASRMRPYLKENASFVEPDLTPSEHPPTPIFADLLRPKGLVRHDPEKVKRVIASLI